ncbi:MAG: rhombosortase [Thiomicrorhabdus sp.]|nr:rhombosortase [Thiomicrorhabdus sp.]
MTVFLDELFFQWLSFQRPLIIDGEYWRLLTAHIVHLNDYHLYLNLAGLWLIWLFVGDRFKLIEWLVLTVVLALIVSLGLVALNPYLESYVGFSGVLHGLLIVGLLKHFNTYEEMVLLVLVVLKLFYEQVFGSFSGSAELINGNVIVDAHFYGAVAGVSYILLRSILVSFRTDF